MKIVESLIHYTWLNILPQSPSFQDELPTIKKECVLHQLCKYQCIVTKSGQDMENALENYLKINLSFIRCARRNHMLQYGFGFTFGLLYYTLNIPVAEPGV